MQTLTKLEQAIVVAHGMRRILSNYKHNERTASLETLAKRLKKFLLKREKSNKRSFIFATEFERIFWLNVTDKYDKTTRILALDFVTSLYSYYGDILSRYSDISPKLMEKIDILANEADATSEEIYEMEQNDKDLLTTYVNMFEPYSSVKMRKSLFAGKKLTIKNNLIIEGKTLDEKFA